MYVGQIVEIGAAEEVLTQPAHPYTRGLIDAHRLEKQGIQVRLHGEVALDVSQHVGCRLADRCPFAESRCDEPQELVAVGDAHQSRCWKANDLRERLRTDDPDYGEKLYEELM
jgi:oligopeptide/dipeptide ABC transporter ATP-binding protein